jgi:tetratricopeptide (TPR) repeat protein
MDEEEARNSINSFLKKAETAEKALIYKEAQKEYEKALYLATGFDFKEDIGRISFMILENDKRISDLDLEYSLNAGEKAEKRKDYINAINYYRQGLILLRKAEDFNGNESRIKKLEKKIVNLQRNLDK